MTRVSRTHRLCNVNVRTKFQGNPSSSCRDISVCACRSTNIAINMLTVNTKCKWSPNFGYIGRKMRYFEVKISNTSVKSAGLCVSCSDLALLCLFNADYLRIEAHLTAALLVSESSSQVISGSVFLSGRQVLRSYWCHLSQQLLTAETALPG